MNLVIKSLVWEVSDNCSVGMGKEKGDWGLLIVGIFTLGKYYFLIRLW